MRISCVWNTEFMRLGEPPEWLHSHICEGDNCELCPACYKATGKEDVCLFTCEHREVS